MTLGLRKIGMKTGDPCSSIGAGGRVYLQDSFLLSLSENDRTDKDVYLMGNSVSTATTMDSGIDAGEYGGLQFSGGVYHESTGKIHKRFALTGSNPTNESVFSGKFERILDNGTNYTMRLVKKGAGIWHLKQNANNRLGGTIAVEEGTLRFDSIAELGLNCALGFSDILTDGFAGPDYTGHMVDYAFLLGGETTEGTMDYTGEGPGLCETRPFAIRSKGRIRSSGGALNLSGFSGFGSGAKTLTLDGGNGAVNTALDIADGEADSLSVVKTGSGTWRIGGKLSFSGDLEVREGTLEVVAPPKGTPFNRYRIWFKENAYASGRYEDFYTAADKSTTILQLSVIGFFDADGKSLTTGLTDVDRGDLAPNTIAFLHPERVSNAGEYGAYGPFNPTKRRMQTTMVKDPTLNEPSTWLGEELWLPEGSAPAVSFDFSYYYGTGDNLSPYAARRNVTAMSVEGSADGITWDEIWSDDRLELTEKRLRWVGPGSVDVEAKPTDTRKLSAGQGFGFDHTATTNDSIVLKQVVSVSAGATLKGCATIRALRIDAASAGTIDGFTFAEDGTLDIVNAPRGAELTLPLEVKNGSLANVANWDVTFDGEARPAYKVAVRDGKLVVVPPGLIIMVK